jgi:hypothetical protein
MFVRSIGIWSACLTAVLGLIASPCPADGDRVRVSIDVEGHLVTPVGREAPVKRAITVAGEFDFLEATAENDAAAVIRAFSTAKATITVDGIPDESTLADDVCRLLFTREGTAAVPAAPDTFLTRAERDLLDIPFDPLLADGLMPEGAVAVNARWKVPADVAAGLLAIDTIEVGTIEARVDRISDLQAHVVFTGIVDGAVDGVPTHVVVEGTCTVQAATDASAGDAPVLYRLVGRPSLVTATLRERRQASHVAPGFEVEARVATIRTPHDGLMAMDDQPVSTARRQGAGGSGLLWYRDPEERFDLVHDVRWRQIEQEAGTLVMRYVDLGALVAQCSITALPPAGTVPPTVEEVQRDIGRSLAGQFERFEEASATVREDGVTVIRIVSAGSADALPFVWIHYVLADGSGRRASLAFMMEASLAKRFGRADRALVEGFRFGAAGLATPPAAKEARLPRKTATP